MSASPEKEPEDLVFATPQEENKPVGTLANHPSADKEDANGNFLGPLNELVASPPYPVNDRGPAGTIQSSPAGQEASEGVVPPSMKSEGEPPTESEPTVVRHQNAKAEGDIVAQPGPNGWSGRELKQVETLLRPHTYPPCGAVASCLREWTQFAHRGEGYREGPAMPGGPDQVFFHTECWDYPEPIAPPVIAGHQKKGPTAENTPAPEAPGAAGESQMTLRERWQATHGMDPPAWAGKGFAGIKEHMKQQAEAAGGADGDTVTIYKSPPDWAPRQRARAFLDPHLPGVQVPVSQLGKCDGDQAIPDHTLPRFRGNPKNNFQVMTSIPEYLRGYWTKEHQSPQWKGDGEGDIRTQESRLKAIIQGYTYAASQRMTTYEFKAPDGLNHGLSMLNDEVEEYLVPLMVDHASALLGDFVALYQEREVNRRKTGQLSQQAMEAKDHWDAETNILRAQLAGAQKELE